MDSDDESCAAVTSSKLNDIEIRFSSNIAYLDLVQDIADNVSKLIGFDADAQYWIALSVREVVTNAIQHGNKEDPEKSVCLTFHIRSDRLIISVKDEGVGLTEDQIPDPLDPQNLLKPGGRGIFFVRSFMDSVTFNILEEGGCEILMEKLISKNKGEENED